MTGRGKESARAQMRRMVKRLLKRYKYPPERYDMVVDTVIKQCEPGRTIAIPKSRTE